jgi:hypothetical protein
VPERSEGNPVYCEQVDFCNAKMSGKKKKHRQENLFSKPMLAFCRPAQVR